MKKIDLPLSLILDDASFRFTTPDAEKISRLSSSMLLGGLRTPVFVIPKQDKYQVLAGFSRIAAAREAGLSAIPAEALDIDEDFVQPFFMVLVEHRCQTDFRLFEKARILKILDTLQPDYQTRNDFLKILGLPDKVSLLDSIRALLMFSPTLLSYLEKYDITLKQVLSFSDFDLSDQDWLAGFGEMLLVRPVELIEIATQLDEISKRDGKPIQTVIQDIEIPSFLTSGVPRSQIISEIRRRIAERRYPRWTEIQANIAMSEKALHLPDFVQVRWDQSLENPGVQLAARLDSVETVDQLIQALQEGVDSKKFQKLFDWAG